MWPNILNKNAELKIIASPQGKHKRIIIRIVVVIDNFLLLTKIVENEEITEFR